MAQKRGGKFRRVSSRAAGQSSSIADLLDVISSGSPSPSLQAARAEGIQILLIQLSSLPEDYRKAIRLHHLEGRSLEEVARSMGRAPDAVRGILYRARKKLRDGLGRSSLYLTKK